MCCPDRAFALQPGESKADRVVPMESKSLCITIDGEETREGVPLQLLATVFRGVQETVYNIAMAESGCRVHLRARVPDDIRTQYQLIRAGEHSSAYTIEVIFGTPVGAAQPVELSDRGMVLSKYTVPSRRSF